MGYKSDVAITMKIDDYKIMRGRIAKLSEEYKNVQYTFEWADIIIKNGVIILKWEDIKWNNCDPEIMWIESFLTELNQAGKPYSFVRVGESREDNEEIIFKGEADEDDSCDLIWLERKIDINI